MKSKKWTRTWWMSLILMNLITLVIIGSNLLGITLPDAIIRIIGIADLIVMGVFSFVSVKSYKENKER